MRKSSSLVARIIGLAFLAMTIMLPATAHAQCEGVNSGAPLQQSVTGFGTEFSKLASKLSSGGNICASPGEKVVGVVQMILGFIGLILVLLILYAGFLWMTAGGEADKVKKAKEILKDSIIGLAILLIAEGITFFILQKLIDIFFGK